MMFLFVILPEEGGASDPNIDNAVGVSNHYMAERSSR
jgi:hypothetical protein